MARFHVEVPHSENISSCVQAVRVFRNTGSHFMTRADWGCRDGEHKAWIVVEAESKAEARSFLPPVFRSQAKITAVEKCSFERVHEFFFHHQD